MNLLIHFLGFPNPFTSSLPLTVPMGLLLHSLGFLDPFASFLPLIILVGLLGIPTCWTLLYYFLFPFSSYCWVSSTIGPFVKSGHQQQQLSKQVLKVKHHLDKLNYIQLEIILIGLINLQSI